MRLLAESGRCRAKYIPGDFRRILSTENESVRKKHKRCHMTYVDASPIILYYMYFLLLCSHRLRPDFFFSPFSLLLSLYFSFDMLFFLEILKDFVKMQHLIRLIFDVFVAVEASRDGFFLLLIFLLHFCPFDYIEY